MLSVFQVQAADPPPPGLISANPGAELWREVRQRGGEVTGTSQVKSTGANVLVNISGQSWREYRRSKIKSRGLARGTRARSPRADSSVGRDAWADHPHGDMR